MKALKMNKAKIFHPDDVPKKQVGQIHALALQLVSKGIVALSVSDQTKLGTEKLTSKDLFVTLPFGKKRTRRGTVTHPAYMIDKYWLGMNMYVDELEEDVTISDMELDE